MPDATPGTGFARPDLTTFARLDDLGLEVTGQRLEPGRAVLACRVVEARPVDVWRHTRRGDKYVTVIINLTPVRSGSGPAPLLDMVEGRSTKAFSSWLAAREQAWRDTVEVVVMNGFTGFKTATTEQLPEAVAVMDPFHVVRLAGDALDRCRRRIQQVVHGHRGRAGDPLYSARRTLHTGAGLLTDKQRGCLTALFAADAHVQVEATLGIYQRMIAAYREPNRAVGKDLMQQLIASTSHGVPNALSEVITLGRTLARRAGDVLAYFDQGYPLGYVR